MLVYFMSDCMHEFISHSMHVLVRAASVRAVAGMLALALAISVLVYLFVELEFVLLLDSVTGMLPGLSLQDLALYLAPGFLLRFLTFFTIILVSNCIVFLSGSHLLGLVPITLFLIGLLVTAGYKTLAAARPCHGFSLSIPGMTQGSMTLCLARVCRALASVTPSSTSLSSACYPFSPP
mgnify:CR=1 FL=1